MDRRLYIQDPDGEVVIVLHNANEPFAVWEKWNGQNLQKAGPEVENDMDEGAPPVSPTPEIPPEDFQDVAAEREDRHDTAPETENNIESKDTEIRIQVSAKHLIFGSPVFKRMLKGSWKESCVFLEKGSVELSAEGWDLEAFLILLQILHGQHHKVPQDNIHPELVAQVAVLADYYECQDAVRFFSDFWFHKLLPSFPAMYGRDLILWLWISWFFRYPTEFEKASLIAITQAKTLIHALALPIPDRVMDDLNAERQNAIAGFTTKWTRSVRNIYRHPRL